MRPNGRYFLGVQYISHFMNIVSTCTPDTMARANDNITTDSIVRYTGYAVGATAVVGSVGVMTIVAPAQMVAAGVITAGCHFAANRMRDGKSVWPSVSELADNNNASTDAEPTVA